MQIINSKYHHKGSKILSCLIETLEMCFRTACKSNVNIVCQHRDNGKFYCPGCARRINDFNPGLVCIPKPENVPHVVAEWIALPPNTEVPVSSLESQERGTTDVFYGDGTT